ncbi:putative immune-type receptor 6a precursor [Silurus asotus]|uniref:Immune-type receptor 6a n=1 Tax=Silurus asotus TaxID=30991 RepID=A0AAD5AG42_SILAS|nr:putative immune-type receptor 6a precursor [Silurus asotus]
MISLFVALYSLLCLCTAVKTSDIKELHVRTVKSGEDVTIACDLSLITDKSKVVWYRQSFGKMPQFFARYQGKNSYTFANGFLDSRFGFTVNEHQFDLNIKNLREDDGGEYFCGETEGTEIKFTSGARLQFEGTMISLFVALYSLLCLCTAVKTSDIKELHVRTVKSGEDVTIACNISMITDKSKVVWYRQSFGKVPQFFAKYYGTNSYRFTDGFNNNRFNFTVNEHQFDLNITNLEEDDGGEYYCGEMEGTTIKFTSGARLQFEGLMETICGLKPAHKGDQGSCAMLKAEVLMQDHLGTSPGRDVVHLSIQCPFRAWPAPAVAILVPPSTVADVEGSPPRRRPLELHQGISSCSRYTRGQS